MRKVPANGAKQGLNPWGEYSRCSIHLPSAIYGEVPERSNGLAWKATRGNTHEGSNPSLTASLEKTMLSLETEESRDTIGARNG